LGVDLWRGENFRGQKIETGQVPEEIYERLTPLFLQDVIDTMRWQGIGTAATIAPFVFHGISVQTYPITPFSEAVKLKDNLSKRYFNGNMWDDIAPAAQKALREQHPEIGFYEDRAKTKRESAEFVGRIANETLQAGRRAYRQLPRSVRQTMKELAVPMPGLSRYIGSGWYLNDKRYKTYQNQVQARLSLILSDLVTDQDWKMLPIDVKREMLKEVISRTTAQIRLELVTKSNIEGIQQLE